MSAATRSQSVLRPQIRAPRPNFVPRNVLLGAAGRGPNGTLACTGHTGSSSCTAGGLQTRMPGPTRPCNPNLGEQRLWQRPTLARYRRTTHTGPGPASCTGGASEARRACRGCTRLHRTPRHINITAGAADCWFPGGILRLHFQTPHTPGPLSQPLLPLLESHVDGRLNIQHLGWKPAFPGYETRPVRSLGQPVLPQEEATGG